MDTKPSKSTKQQLIANLPSVDISDNNADDNYVLLAFFVSYHLKLYHNFPYDLCEELMSFVKPKNSSIHLTKYCGHYNWCNDGTNVNGDIILKRNYSVGSNCGWNGITWNVKYGFIIIHFNGITHWMQSNHNSNDKKLILYYPIRNPPSTAIFIQPLKEIIDTENNDMNDDQLMKLTEKHLYGEWNWCHNGTDKNGNIVFENNGVLSTTTNRWFGGRWCLVNNVLFVRFNNVDHIMVLNDSNCNELILIEPKRKPPSVATKFMAK
eukprot:431349_1